MLARTSVSFPALTIADKRTSSRVGPSSSRKVSLWCSSGVTVSPRSGAKDSKSFRSGEQPDFADDFA